VIQRIGFVVLLLAMASPSTAADKKEIERLALQVANLQGQVISVQRSLDEALAELRRLNQTLAQQSNTIRTSVEEERRRSEASQVALRDVVDRLGELSETVQAIRGGGMVGLPPLTAPADGNSPATDVDPAGSAPPPRELYQQAYADLALGNYEIAIQGFETYLEHYPETEFSDNARYWIGECYYGQKKHAEAIEAWNTLLRDFPSSDKVPDARVKKGMSLEHLGRRSQALLEYRYVLDRYPNAPAARIAREKLNPN
jgi:tol-pal system protein YbgF